MPLFGGGWRRSGPPSFAPGLVDAGASSMGPPFVAPQAPSPAARRGIFGRRKTGGGGRSLGDILGVVGAGLQQMDGGSELTDYLATQRDNARQDQTDAQNAELMQLRMQGAKRESIQQQQLEEMISTLPQEAQVWARLNPEAFVTAMIRRQTDGGWQSGQGYSHLWRPTPDGHVELGDPLPLRPRQGSAPYGADTDEEGWSYD